MGRETLFDQDDRTTWLRPFLQDSALRCPWCWSDYLHHCRVEIFERRVEDAEHGLHVTVDGGAVAIDENQLGNPSERRAGLRIWLWCEGCGKHCMLTLAQHKGQTFVGLDSVPERKEEG
jgi:hypothetical protein